MSPNVFLNKKGGWRMMASDFGSVDFGVLFLWVGLMFLVWFQSRDYSTYPGIGVTSGMGQGGCFHQAAAGGLEYGQFGVFVGLGMGVYSISESFTGTYDGSVGGRAGRKIMPTWFYLSFLHTFLVMPLVAELHWQYIDLSMFYPRILRCKP